MPAAAQYAIAPRVRRISISIPAAAGTAVTLYSLVAPSLGLADTYNIIGARINPTTANYNVGDTAATQPLTIATPAAYEEPAINVLQATFVKASAGAAVTAVVSVYLAGDGRGGLS
jgi:hypothetical protein